MLAVLLFAALCLAPGIPAAVVVGRRQGERAWGEVLVEGLFLGLLWWLVLGLVLAHASRFEAAWLVGATVVVTTGLVAVALPELRRLPRPRLTSAGAATAAVLAVALWARRDPFYLLYQTSDFSEYLRAGTALARGAPLAGYFLHLFKVPLGLSGLALGTEGAVAVIPFLGLLVPVGVASLAVRLGAGSGVAVVVLALTALDPLAVWYGRFPASEVLYAAVFVGQLLLLAEALRRRSPPLGLLAGACTFALLLTRGNAVLLAPVLLLAVVAAAAVAPRRTLGVLVSFGGATALAGYAGFVYGHRYSGQYVVDQLELDRFVPEPLFRYVDSLGQLPDAAVGLAVVVVGTAAVLAVAAVLNRADLPWLARGVLPAAVAVVVAAVVGPLDVDGLADGLGRMGLGLLTLGAVGVGVLTARAHRLEPPARVLAAVVVVAGGVFVLFHAYRFDSPRDAPFFFYWDRYLYSEVFPLLGLAAAAGAAAVWAGVRRLERPAALAAGAGLAAVGVLAVAQLVARDGLPRERQLFDDAYDQVGALDRLTSSPVALPIVWDGLRPDQLPPGWAEVELSASTYRVVASPLQETFGRVVLNQIASGLDPDPEVAGDEGVAALLREGGAERAYVVSVRTPGRAVPASAGGRPDLVTSADVGSLDLRIPVLPREVDPDDEAWVELVLTLDVTLVELA